MFSWHNFIEAKLTQEKKYANLALNIEWVQLNQLCRTCRHTKCWNKTSLDSWAGITRALFRNRQSAEVIIILMWVFGVTWGALEISQPTLKIECAQLHQLYRNCRLRECDLIWGQERPSMDGKHLMRSFRCESSVPHQSFREGDVNRKEKEARKSGYVHLSRVIESVGSQNLGTSVCLDWCRVLL